MAAVCILLLLPIKLDLTFSSSLEVPRAAINWTIGDSTTDSRAGGTEEYLR